MSEIRISMRVLWVSEEGAIRSVNMDGSRPIPEWAGRTVLSVNLLGPIKGRQFIAFTEFQFHAVKLDSDGYRIRGYGDRAVAVISELLFNPSKSAVLPYSLPNAIQQEVIYAYIVKRWPQPMSKSNSKLAWHKAIRSAPETNSRQFRWAGRPFRDDQFLDES